MPRKWWVLSVREKYDSTERLIIQKMKTWEHNLVHISNRAEALLKMEKDNESTPIHQARKEISEIKEKADAARLDITSMENNLGDIVELFNAKKAALEVTKAAIDAWPPRRFSEKLLWIGYALFPAGGVSLALIPSDDDMGLRVAVSFWIIGLCYMAAALWDILKDDRRKWKYFSNEAGIKEEDADDGSNRRGLRSLNEQ